MSDIVDWVETLASNGAGRDHNSWAPINLNTIGDQPPVAPELADTGLIYPGMRHVFSGPPESAKTLAAYAVLIQNARHHQLGILIDFEMGPYDACRRLIELGATPDDLNLIPYIHPDTPANTVQMEALAQLRPKLVVLDAAAGAFDLQGLDDNKRGDVQKLTNLYVDIFWEHVISTITIDHVIKDAQNRGRFQIGSERKLGGTDVHIGFDTIKPISRGTNGHYKLIVHKDRGGWHKRGHLCDLKLDSDPDTHMITWAFTDPEPTTDDAGYFRPTHLMEKVSVDLEHRSEPISRNATCASVGGNREYVLKAIDALVRESFLTETAGPNRSKLLETTRRYREDDPACNPETSPGNSVVPVWFQSGSENQSVSGGSVVLPPYGADTTRPPTSQPPEPLGWFSENDELFDTYYDAIAPEPEDT